MNINPFDTKEPLTFDASLKMGVYADAGVKLKFWELDVAEWNTTFKLSDEKTFWSYTFPQDMENKKNDRVTKVLEKATEAIKAAQSKVKENIFPQSVIHSLSSTKQKSEPQGPLFFCVCPARTSGGHARVRQFRALSSAPFVPALPHNPHRVLQIKSPKTLLFA
jgi:hypothetical protein